MSEIIPYVRMDQITEFIKSLPNEAPSIKEITTKTKFGKSTVENVIPSLQLLKIVEYSGKERILKLTNQGQRFRTALITNDQRTAAEAVKESVNASEALSYVKGLLERKGSLNVLEIGKELSFKFDKKWKNIITFKTYGAACATILDFVGYGVYDRGVLRKEEVQVVKREITPPYTTFKKMVNIIEAVSTYNEVDIHTLAERLQTKEGRLAMEIKNCMDLGFLQRPAPGKIAITQKGRELVDPLNKNNEGEAWAGALLNSEFSALIESIGETEFSMEDLGNILKHKLGGKWLERKTIISFGKKFLNWLRFANLIQESGKEKYRLTTSAIKEKRKPETIQVMSTVDYYELGKSVGILLSPLGEFERSRLAIDKLIKICEREKTLSTITELLNDHKALFLEIKDNRIFHADIKLIEKCLGIEEWSPELNTVGTKLEEIKP